MGLKEKVVFWFIKREVIQMLNKAKNFLSGYMTYITAISGILGAIVSWQQGIITTEEAVKIIWIGILTIFGRRAIEKAELK